MLNKDNEIVLIFDDKPKILLKLSLTLEDNKKSFKKDIL